MSARDLHSDIKSNSRWFHPSISGKEAENLLMKNGYSGCFLVRESKSKVGNFTLSVRRGNEVIHVKIFNNGDYYDIATGTEFASLYELVSYYTEEGNPLREKNGNLLEPKFPLYVDESQMLDKWFHGNLDGKKAEGLLLQHGTKNCFLVRERAKTPGEFVLCVFIGSAVTQIIIVCQHGQYCVQAATVENKFSSLSDLVEHYKKHQIEPSTGCPFTLGEPVLIASASKKESDVSKPKENPSSRKVDKYQEEFEQLQKLECLNKSSRKEGQRPENKEKNRYKNILPFDHSRVILQDGDPTVPCSDYINANYIKIDSCSVEYIATQGCLAATVPDFWRMIWQEGTQIITMITKRVEQGKNKCILYWPEKPDQPLIYPLYRSRVMVKFVRSKAGPHNEYAIREFLLTYEKEEADKPGSYTTVGKRTVFQYNFVAWPDKSVPQQPNSLLSFIMKIHEHQKSLQDAGPIAVHCSAGIGRTGTFIVIGILVNGIETKGQKFKVDVKSVISQIRTMRSGMVQVDQQYKLIHDVMQYYIKTYASKNCSESEYVNLEDSVNEDKSKQNGDAVYANV